MKISVHQPQYIPWLGYFDKIDKSDAFVFLDKVQYKAREFQNRNKIRTGNGWLMLTVPVISRGLGRQEISKVEIDNSTDWQKKHWGSIEQNYHRAPYFKNYSGFFKEVYSCPWERLMDLNIHIIKYLLKELKIQTPLYYESVVGSSSNKTDRIIEICKKLNADIYLSGIGGRDYLEEEKFTREGIKLEYQSFNHPVYHQLYRKGAGSFMPYLSVVDLLFNEGEKSIDILRGRVKYAGNQG
ncbi:MAG: WbqC family protein [bacterium]